MVVILLIFGKLTVTKALLDLYRHNLKFGCEVLLLFGVFHKIYVLSYYLSIDIQI